MYPYIKKLDYYLSEKKIFEEEAEVVYVLVQTRKLIETKPDDMYVYIKYMCNWALHASKQRQHDILKDTFDKISAELSLAIDVIHETSEEFATFLKFRNELKDLYEKEDFISRPFQDFTQWSTFMYNFEKAVSGQPIVYKSADGLLINLSFENDYYKVLISNNLGKKFSVGQSYS